MIAQATDSLLGSLTRAARRADAKVLLRPASSAGFVRSRNRVAGNIGEFHELLGLDIGSSDWKARQWTDAAADARGLAIEIVRPVATGRRRSRSGTPCPIQREEDLSKYSDLGDAC